MLVIRCKNCNTEISGHFTKVKSCGCPNMAMIRNDVISANDLKLIEIISGTYTHKKENKNNFLTKEDLEFQEARKNRKVRKLEYEVR